MPTDLELLSVNNRSEWRAWLAANYRRAAAAWVVIYKTGPRKTWLTLDDVQEEALCFGWVDVKNKRLDDERYALLFCPRRAGSAWSISNIRRIEQLTAAGLMTEAGMATVTEAHANGQWAIALQVAQTDIIPPELEQSLRQQRGALLAYRNLTHSRRRQLLRQLLTAKTAATRQRRIESIVNEAISAGRSWD